MANKHLSLFPKKIDKNNWYYEDIDGIEIVHVPVNYQDTAHIKIPWRKIRASLRRKDRKL